MRITPYLKTMVEENASDLYVVAGVPPSIRVEGHIEHLDVPILMEEHIEELVKDFLTEDQYEEFRSTLELNIATSLENGERFRINLFVQKRSTAFVVRHIKSQIPTIEQLRLPPIYKRFIMEKRGLVLMAGATGSGKSTSLAAMINHRNLEKSGHIITVEDPIEFFHEPKKCIVTQRELGIDTYSYGIALKNALRQSPDIILIGEIRDRETLENAILFCETGHLVVATIHANNSHQTLERIINLFPEEMKMQILTTLSQNLHAIISQRLIDGVHNQRVLAHEIMINEALVKVLIAEDKITELKEIMEKNEDQGMITFDNCLLKLIMEEKISIETALQEADNPSNLRLKITQTTLAIQQASNIANTNIASSSHYHDPHSNATNHGESYGEANKPHNDDGQVKYQLDFNRNIDDDTPNNGGKNRPLNKNNGGFDAQDLEFF